MRSKLSKYISISAFLLLNVQSLPAYEERPIYRFLGGYSLYSHKTDFDSLPGIKYFDPDFNDNTDGKGFFFGFSYELPLPYNMFFCLKGTFTHFDATFEKTFSQSLLQNNIPTDGLYSHKFNCDFSAININPYIRFYLIDDLSVTFGGFVAPFVQKSYSNIEQVNSPNGAVFRDNLSDKRNKISGDFKGSKGVSGGINLGIGYDIPLNTQKTFLVTPEVSYSVGLNDIIEQSNWKANSLSFSLAVCYAPVPKIIKKEVSTSKFVYDTLRIPNKEFKYDTFIAGKADTSYLSNETDSTIIQNRIIRRSDTLYTKIAHQLSISPSNETIHIVDQNISQAFKMLNYVFFDNNSDKLLSSYNKIDFSDEFEIGEIAPNSIQLHKDLLNIIGYRMQKYPNSEIFLQGFSARGESADVAVKRESAIRNYLSKIWKINGARIKSNNKDNSSFSNNASELTQAENQCVIITTGDDEILAPISFENFNNINKIEPHNIHFAVTAKNFDKLQRWEYIVYQGAEQLAYETGQDTLPESFDFSPEMNIDRIDYSKPLEITLAVTDRNGSIKVDSKEIAINYEHSASKVKRLAVYLFDIDNSDIPEAANKEISELLRGIPSDAIVSIYGYSDQIGERSYNIELSQKRADNTAKLLMRLKPELHIQNIKGIGYNSYPPDINSYASPIERFLSRTVVIDISMP